MDEVFKALADPTRRSLLDELFREDGQTLSALEERLPMTRFGVMKHLRVLEEAHLVTTKRRGREKLHFLNPVPIRLVHDRWVSKYAEPWAATLSGLKQRLEDGTMEKVFEIYIKTTPERLWEAITDSEMRASTPSGSGIARTGRPGPATRRSTGAGIRIPRARTWRSIRRAGSCRASMPCGATTCRARERRGSPGKSSRSPTPAG